MSARLPRQGEMLEFPRGDRAVFLRLNVFRNTFHVRWVRSDSIPVGTETEIDGLVLDAVRVIEAAP